MHDLTLYIGSFGTGVMIAIIALAFERLTRNDQ